ncbi:MAG TPA: IS1595 family transposase [Bryobacteraceae bacterium]|nr:IS1595 family transposase [Bryobacteraceae bacterium]
MSKVPTTLQEAILYFSNYENCQRFMIALRWDDGRVRCPYCDSEKVTYLENARLWKCYGKHPKAKFSLKVGTIFEDSPIGLDKWFAALWMLVNCKNGISSHELARDLGVTQKTAWFMLQRLRLALQQGGFGKIGGQVEVDETYIGGKARNMHKDRKAKKLQGKGGGFSDKVGVQGMLQRGGEIRLAVIRDSSGFTLKPNIRANVEPGSHLFTDEAKAYFGLQEDYVHDVINHAEAYVNGQIHTNSLESFWSLLKRGLGGTYVCVEPFHLFRYVDEQAFRYNNRKDMNDLERFAKALSQVGGKRLTYEHLTGKDREADPNPM